MKSFVSLAVIAIVAGIMLVLLWMNAYKRPEVMSPDMAKGARDDTPSPQVALPSSARDAFEGIPYTAIPRTVSNVNSAEACMYRYLAFVQSRQFDEAGKNLVFSERAAPVVTFMYERLPEEIRQHVASPGAMWAMLMSANPKRQHPVERQAIGVREMNVGEMSLIGRMRFANGNVMEHSPTFRRCDDGVWRQVVKDDLIAPFYAQPNYTAKLLSQVKGLEFAIEKDSASTRPTYVVNSLSDILANESDKFARRRNH